MITRREAQCHAFIQETIASTGRAPFQYEIATHLGTQSRGFVCRIIASLEAKGFLRVRKYEVRGIELIQSDNRIAA